MTLEEIRNRFSFHPATTPGRAEAHTDMRHAAAVMAGIINELVPEGREKELAMTKLEEVMFWGNAGIARQA